MTSPIVDVDDDGIRHKTRGPFNLNAN